MCDNLVDLKEEREARIQRLISIARALHCPTRWQIIDIIGTKEKRTEEILEALWKRGHRLTRPGLYYHLSELKEAGIIEVAEFIEEGRGAPRKTWKIVMNRIEIDLLPREAGT